MKVEFGSIEHLNASLLPKKIAIVTDHIVEKLYGKALQTRLEQLGKHPSVISFPPGEIHKTRATKEYIEDEMMQKGFGRDCAVIGFGGGVVTDLAGFVASTYCRGVPLFLIPTTLTAMVDAAIGGKTAVNTSFGKNLIGSFYFPQLTLVDISYLTSLPLSELKNGIIEMLKHGLIADAKYFNYLVENADRVMQLEPNVLLKALEHGIAIKQNIVKKDPEEIGLRRVLNFGHTIGHAIEKHMNYNISHGEAVAIGILGECQFSMISSEEKKTIQDALKRYQFSFNLVLDPKEVLLAMSLDKKSLSGLPRFVLLESIGKSKSYNGSFCTAVDRQILEQTLNWLCDVVRSY